MPSSSTSIAVSLRYFDSCTPKANPVQGNKVFVQGIFKSRKRFEALRSFTLESGQLEIERLNQRGKEAAEASHPPSSPTQASRNSSVDSIRSPLSARTPTLSDVPEEGGAFAIGDDDESEDEEQEILRTPSQSSPSTHNSRTASVSSSTEEPLPTQLRGMSEKARGKMPAGQPSFSRQNSTTSLNNYAVTISSPTSGFDPTAHWIDSWLPTLPLHTILTILSSPSPPKELPPGLDPSPPRVHLFEWTPLSLGWYESLLWGFIFASEMVVQKGTVGVWNGTAVRLFKVETVAATGPSLMKVRTFRDYFLLNSYLSIGLFGSHGPCRSVTYVSKHCPFLCKHAN